MKHVLALLIGISGICVAGSALAERPVTRVHAPSELLLPANVHPETVHAVITKTYSDRVEGHIVLKNAQVIRYETHRSVPLTVIETPDLLAQSR